MRNKMARDFCVECINQVLSDGTNSYIENPAIKFTEMAKNGDFDPLSEEEYTALLSEVEILAKLFNNRPRRAAGSILLDVLTNAPRVSYKLKDDLADLFGRLLAGPGDEEIPPLSPETIQAIEDYVCEQTEEMLEDLEKRFDHIGEEMLRESLRMPPPKKIRDNITKKVIGQPEAVKAAAMIVYNHLSGRRTNAVFAGPSGCGKSEIWRTLSKEYPGLVRMIDFSRFAADGWRGSLHLRDIFNGVGSDDIRRRGLIVVLDEADKRLCEPAIGSGGTDYNVLLQNDLLKMMDGDVIEFGAEDRQPALSVDCSKVSVVMLGAFERLLAGKAKDAKRIGFSTAPKADAGGHKDISYHDLIHAGMRLEIAGGSIKSSRWSSCPWTATRPYSEARCCPACGSPPAARSASTAPPVTRLRSGPLNPDWASAGCAPQSSTPLMTPCLMPPKRRHGRSPWRTAGCAAGRGSSVRAAGPA